MPTLKELIKRSLDLYQTSKYCRHQWVRKSYYLYQTGKHRNLAFKKEY